ncbi:hypothetical protein [Carnobacterium inhibens]|uniref:hypothetical protein n=1 Tax=Carnobacterium inhibens TaxID=147709 RepID=UPI000554FE4C|nr:hypothetical protein [Carnobacterium inhibens]
MELVQYKVFINNKNSRLDIIKILEKDYYFFVRSTMNNGYSQIIISSDIMLKVLRKFFIEKKAKIVTIDFFEEDNDYKNQLELLISSVNRDRDYFINLMDELSFLSEKQSVDIKSIRIKYRKNDKPIDISLSVNGLVKIGGNDKVDEEIIFLNEVIWENVKLWI